MNEKYPLALNEGTVLAGQYIIEKVLGQGGFGITYQAIDHKTGQKVAVKEFFPDAMATRTQATTVMPFSGERGESYEYGKACFLQEAETLAEFIGNENIVRIHSYFEENGTAYFVMDFIEGMSFDNVIKQRGGKVSVDEAINTLVPIMDALGAVHSKGIIHRDVTPDNIYITNSGVVKLLDFGAARYSLGDKSRSLDVVLKHGFAPKEQYTRRGKQGPFTDIYAMGASFYYAITGKRPPDSVERMDDDELVPPSSLGVQINPHVEDAILKALNVQPQDRFQSMAEFKAALLGQAPVSAPATGQPVQQRYFGTEQQAPVQQAPMQPTQMQQAPIQQTQMQQPQQNTVIGQTAYGTTGQTVYQTVGQTTYQNQQQAAPGSAPEASEAPKKKKKWLIPVIAGGASAFLLIPAIVLIIVFVIIPKSQVNNLSRNDEPINSHTTDTDPTPSPTVDLPTDTNPGTDVTPLPLDGFGNPAGDEDGPSIDVKPEGTTYTSTDRKTNPEIYGSVSNMRNWGMLTGDGYYCYADDGQPVIASYYDTYTDTFYGIDVSSWQAVTKTGNTVSTIPQIENLGIGEVSELYVSDDYYFVLDSNDCLYCLDKSNGDICGTKYMRDVFSFTFYYTGWLVYVETDSNGHDIMYGVPAGCIDDYSQVLTLSDLTSDGVQDVKLFADFIGNIFVTGFSTSTGAPILYTYYYNDNDEFVYDWCTTNDNYVQIKDVAGMYDNCYCLLEKKDGTYDIIDYEKADLEMWIKWSFPAGAEITGMCAAIDNANELVVGYRIEDDNGFRFEYLIENPETREWSPYVNYTWY